MEIKEIYLTIILYTIRSNGFTNSMNLEYNIVPRFY